jgi:hypothetical protein
MYNNRTNQVYLHKDILHSNIEEALHVYLHEANHHITGLDDSSRGFADNLCHMLSNLLLRYSRDAGISGKVYLSDTGSITIPIPFTGSQATYANIAAIGNKLLIYANNSLLEIDLPIVLATPVCGVKKVCYMDNSYQLKLPSKLVSALGYVTKVELMNCVIRFNNSLFSPALKKLK